MSPRRTLGLDPSLSNYGYCVLEGAHVVTSGRLHSSSSDLYISRYTQMRETLLQIIKEHDIQRVGLEFPVFHDLFSEGMYGLFLFTSEALYLAKTDVVFFSPMQTKAIAREKLGRPISWKMEKLDMREAATLASDKKTWTSDEADAFWAGHTGGRFWSLVDGELTEDALTPVEKRLFLDVKTPSKGKRAGLTTFKGVVYREDERFFRWSKDR